MFIIIIIIIITPTSTWIKSATSTTEHTSVTNVKGYVGWICVYVDAVNICYVLKINNMFTSGIFIFPTFL